MLVNDLFALAKTVGRLDARALERAPNLVMLPRYAEIEDAAEKNDAILNDLEESAASLPDDYRRHARLLLSFDEAGTNLTHRRGVYEPKNVAFQVTKLRERYTLAQVATELIIRAGRSLSTDRGPGYRHDRIAYHITVAAENKLVHTCVTDYDIHIVRDATRLFMVANDDEHDGPFEALPWKVRSSDDQLDVGTVPLDPSIADGATLSVVYLGRSYSRDETCHISMFQERTYQTARSEYVCDSDTPHRPIEIDLMVDCPLAWAPTYDRVIYASGGRAALEVDRKRVVRETDEPMTFHINGTKPSHTYGIRWTM